MENFVKACDHLSGFLLNPSNHLYSPKTQAFAWVATLFLGITTLGSAHLACACWRKIRHIQVKNETQEKIAHFFKKIFGKENHANHAISTLNETHLATEALLAPEPLPVIPPQFSTSDLLTFRAALQKASIISLHWGGEYYMISFTDPLNKEGSSINIQNFPNYLKAKQEGKIGIAINQGRIASIWVNGASINSLTIPDASVPLLKACFNRALEVSSAYGVQFPPVLDNSVASLQIRVIRRGIKEIPEYHLEKFSHLIDEGVKQQKDPKICVVFMNNDLTISDGGDAGGLSRDYLDDLFDGLTKKGYLSFKSTADGYLMPKTKKAYEKGDLPPLEAEELAQYQQMGQVMMYCYNSQPIAGHWAKTYAIGRHFNNALFTGALSLTAEEIDTPFKELPLQTKLNMITALAKGDENYGVYKERIDLLSKGDLNQEDLKKAAEIAGYLDLLPDYLKNKDDMPDMDKINSHADNKKLVFQALAESLFKYYGEELAPLHAIAQGMKSMCGSNKTWNESFKTLSIHEVSNKIQGSIDRQEIFDSIELDSDLSGPKKAEVMKKMNWLKDWLKDEASEEELRKTLKFFTASSSLPKGKKISVKAQFPQDDLPIIPVPRTHTCSFEVELAPHPSGDLEGYHDHTKEEFIRCIKELALTDPGAYSMN